MRIGDILKIKLSDIQDSDLHVTIEKTEKKVVFKVADDLAEVIARVRALPRPVMSIYLFSSQQGIKMSYSSFNKQWTRLLKNVGLDGMNLHFHDMRAKAATDAGDMGVDAQKLLGHKQRAMTDHYIKSRQIDKVTPLKKLNTEEKY